MNRRRAMIAGLLSLVGLRSALAQEAVTPPPADVPDELLKALAGPRIKLALADGEYRKEMVAQFERCFGEPYRELIFKSTIDQSPDLLRHPVILKELRERLKLPKRSPTQLRIDYKTEHGEL